MKPRLRFCLIRELCCYLLLDVAFEAKGMQTFRISHAAPLVLFYLFPGTVLRRSIIGEEPKKYFAVAIRMPLPYPYPRFVVGCEHSGFRRTKRLPHNLHAVVTQVETHPKAALIMNFLAISFANARILRVIA